MILYKVRPSNGESIILVLHFFADVPQLPAMPGFDEMQQQPEEFDSDDEDYDDDTASQSADKTYKRPSGPKVQDPYAADDTNSMLLPIVVAIGAFIPILFCLCKL